MKKLVFGATLLLHCAYYAQFTNCSAIQQTAPSSTVMVEKLCPEEFTTQLIEKMNSFTVSSYDLPLSQRLTSCGFYGVAGFLTASAVKALLNRYSNYKPTMSVLIPTTAVMAGELLIPRSVKYVSGVAGALDKKLIVLILKNDRVQLDNYLTQVHASKNPALPKNMPLVMLNIYMNAAVNMVKNLKTNNQDTSRGVLLTQLEYVAQEVKTAVTTPRL